MYKQLFLVPKHIYSNVKQCIESADEMSELAELNQNFKPDYITDAINKEKKPDKLNQSSNSSNSNIINSSVLDFSKTSIKDISKPAAILNCPFCNKSYKKMHNLKKHKERYCKFNDEINNQSTLNQSSSVSPATSTPIKPTYVPQPELLTDTAGGSLYKTVEGRSVLPTDIVENWNEKNKKSPKKVDKKIDIEKSATKANKRKHPMTNKAPPYSPAITRSKMSKYESYNKS